jgi:hypothetical protein
MVFEYVRVIQQVFRGNVSPVETLPAEETFFDDSDRLPLVGGGVGYVESRHRTDDEIELFHGGSDGVSQYRTPSLLV